MKKLLAVTALAAAVASLAMVAVTLVDHAEEGAQAGGPVVVGIDMNPSAAPANSCPNNGNNCTLGTIEACAQLPSGGGTVEFDVYLEGLPAGDGLLGGSYHMGEMHDLLVGPITAYTHTNPLVNLWAQPGSSMTDFSDPVGTVVPSFDASVADFGAAEYNPPYTHGTLGRYTIDTTGKADGIYGLTLDSVILGRDVPPNGDLCYVDPNCDVKDAFDGFGLIAVGAPCPMPADLKIVGQQILASDCASPPPSQVNVSENVDICLKKVLHNNGPGAPVLTDITKTAAAPADCTITPGSASAQVNLPLSVDTVHTELLTIHCTKASTHGPFRIMNEIEALYFVDPVPANNSATSALTVNAIGWADVKDISYAPTSLPPVHLVIGLPYIQLDATGIATGAVIMTKVLQDNGPWGPVTVSASSASAIVAYTGMAVANADCTVAAPGALHAQVSLPLSMSVSLNENYTLTCGRGGITKDDDGDGRVDEDQVDGIDNDGDTVVDEDSPFYLVTIAFQDGASVPKDPHVLDDNLANNVLPGPIEVTVAVGMPRLAPFIRLNELAFDPLGEDAGQESVEIINRDLLPINVAGWTVTDRDAVPIATLPSVSLPPNGLLVVHFGVGIDDLDLSDDEGHFYTGSAVEVLDNLEDEVALFAGAPSGSTIADFFVYSFPDYTPGPAHDLAVQAGIWTAGEFFPGGVPLDEGSTLGRDSLSTDMDLPFDWYSDGGVDAAGPTPGRVNLDPLSAGDLGIGVDSGGSVEASSPQQQDGLKRQLELLKKVVEQICDKHRRLFESEFLDEDFKKWCDDPNRGFTEGKDKNGRPYVEIDNMRITLVGGRPFAGWTSWPNTPQGKGDVLINRQRMDEKEWLWKEVVLHELVHVATLRKPNLGGWEKTGKPFPDDYAPAKDRAQVEPCHEPFAYATEFKLKQELIKGLPTKEQAREAKRNAKTPEEKKLADKMEKEAKTRSEIEEELAKRVRSLDPQYLDRCLAYLGRLRQFGAQDLTSPWHRFGKHLDELLKKVRDKIMEKKTWVALSNGSISREELAGLTELWYRLFDPERRTESREVKEKIRNLKTQIEEEARDTDQDGLPDIDEGAFGTNRWDPDADRDGLSDGIEAAVLGPGTHPLNPDTDGDSVPDGTEVATGSDPLDPMSTPESLDIGGTCSDGRDNDLDGLSDGADPGCTPSNSDEDTVPDASDNCPFDANADQADSDGDGLGDACDEDDDGDTFGDELETVLGSDPLSAASTPEHFSVPTACTDGGDNDLNGLIDAADEGCIPLRDTDADGVSDAVDNCLELANHDQTDLQKDGVGDACDSDDDNDGFEDALDLCPFNSEDFDGFQDAEGCPDPDNDADGVADDVDNCCDAANPGQDDQDSDGIGDACDASPSNPDADADGVVDGRDNCPSVANADQQDADGDGAGDVCDDDEDSDDVLGAQDNCRLIYNPGQDDTDLDGLGDDCDGDDDGDGLADPRDNCPDTLNADQADLDGDTQGDACDWDDDNDTVDDPADNCARTPNSRQVDGDGDDIGDACSADLRVVDQYVINPPAQIPVSEDVLVVLDKVIHNDGPAEPVEAVTETVVSAPAGCTVRPPVHIEQFHNLPVSVDILHHEPFIIHCYSLGSYTFTFDDEVSPKEPHVRDPVSNNNTAQTTLAVKSVAEADVKITSVSFLNPPTKIPLNQDVDVTLQKHIHNNGPRSPVDIAINSTASAPTGCTIVPKNVPASIPGVPVSVDQVVDEVWTIRCTQAGLKTFVFNNSIDVSTPDVFDFNLANNAVRKRLSVRDPSYPYWGDDICDGQDNNGDTVIDEDWDLLGNPVADCLDRALDTDGDTLANDVDADDDGDGWSDAKEGFMRTDPLNACPLDVYHDAWPPDVDNGGSATIMDVLAYKPALGGAYDQRYDLNASGTITIMDVLLYKPVLGASCAGP